MSQNKCCDCGKEIDRRSTRCPSCSSRFRETRGLTTEQRFWSRVDKNGPIMPYMTTACWIWIGFKIKSGYGQFKSEIKSRYAHRYSYYLHYGPYSESLDICHHCDNPACINPEHLFAGTVQDNMDDMKKKDRACKGEKSSTSKLTQNDVIEIRQIYAKNKISFRQLARRYNVHNSTIGNIVKGISWKHI